MAVSKSKTKTTTKTKTKTKTNKNKPSEPTEPTPAARPAASPATRAEAVLQALTSKWPAPTNAERSLLGAKYTDAKCEGMGAGTKSEGVLSDALKWAPIIDKALGSHPVELRRYSPKRFAWFLSCVAGLVAARAAQQIKGGAAVAQKVGLQKAQQAALGARTELVDSLEELVEGNETEEALLSGALGATDRPDRLVESIGTLAAYARSWLTRKDEGSKFLVTSSGLTLAEVETAENAAQALAQASAGKTLEGAVIVRDSPEVNRIEGRVLLEMRAAMRVFNKAHARNKQVPKLVPGDATRSALAPRVSKAGAVPPVEPAPKKDG